MLGDERVVVEETLVNTGETSVDDEDGEDISGVIIFDRAKAGSMEIFWDESEDILTAWIL